MGGRNRSDMGPPMSHRWITTKVSMMTMVATVLTFTMVFGTLVWTAFISNRQAARDSIMMVNGGLESMAAHLRNWTEQVGAADGQLTLFAAQEDGWDLTGISWRAVDIPEDILEQVQPSIANETLKSGDTFYAISDGQLHQFLVKLQGDIALAARPLDAGTVAGFGAMFLLDDLRVANQPTETDARLPLRDATGATMGYLVWSPAQPGATTIEIATLPVSAALSLFVVLALAILRASRGNVKALNAREAETTLIERRDSLTDLPNRVAFGEHLTDLMHASQHEIAILVMDINNFKRINDLGGHAVGDELVAILALRLRDALSENVFLARVGGDEFRAIFSGFAALDERDIFFNKLRDLQEKPITVDGRPFNVTLAVGHAAGFPSDITSVDLLRQADLAMYEAKNLGLKEPLAYHDGIENDHAQKHRIEEALRDALKTGEEFEVCYQPIIRASTGQMVLAEALIRWKSSALGRMSPDRFIPIAEASGLIVPLGKCLMSQVCSDLRAWSALKVAVNLSPAQLRDPDFMTDTANIIKNHGVLPQRIEFELTEGIFVEDPTLAGQKLSELRKMGHGISLDDFGTGFSSIGYLRQMKFDKLKIDKSFIDDVGTGTADAN